MDWRQLWEIVSAPDNVPIVGLIPLLGHEGPLGKQLGMTPYNDVRFGLLGGSIVDANALLRSYIWHCIGIPIVASVLMMVHFWRVRKDGGISGPAPVMLASEVKERR